jgi:hypothetical protein
MSINAGAAGKIKASSDGALDPPIFKTRDKAPGFDS